MGAAAATDPDEARVWAIAAELRDARKRGWDALDASTRRTPALPLPELEALARHYSGDDVSNRIGLIRQLLSDALDAWATQQQGRYADDAALVRDLFFARPGASAAQRHPTTLLHDVMRRRDLTEDQLQDRRKLAFERFARFLVGFAGSETRPAPRGWMRSHASWIVAGLLALVLVVGAGVTWALWPDSSGRAAGGSDQNSPAAATGGARFTFDALGGGSAYINVYPGVQDSPADRLANGTFADGQTTTALCKTTGRTVRSDPGVGERPRESDVWLQVLAQPGKTSFATLTYAAIDDSSLKTLPLC